ncbi:unnamed protein product [Bursaphelenchus xylophilus]|uniref:(pine wood nematode) hypothetical protein n=1 Tax=Bursaphelenchus xylophilus TaxID=6326 RepID=A0A1I7SEK5_BURXY|nr:unnamed protein product [Bursaphelenchus xylophilus]CAG9113596.1 unnamed protein product [Bursaphelenchus xylophilus]
MSLEKFIFPARCAIFISQNVNSALMFLLTFTVKYVRPSRPFCCAIVVLLNLISTSFFIAAFAILLQIKLDQHVDDPPDDILHLRRFMSEANTTNIIPKSSLYKFVGPYSNTLMKYAAAWCAAFGFLCTFNVSGRILYSWNVKLIANHRYYL